MFFFPFVFFMNLHSSVDLNQVLCSFHNIKKKKANVYTLSHSKVLGLVHYCMYPWLQSP